MSAPDPYLVLPLASVQRIDAGIFLCIEGLAASGCPPLQMSSRVPLQRVGWPAALTSIR